jgi:hypothetical protein
MPELSWFPILGALIVIVTAFVLLISPNWRASLATLALQYLGVFILVSTESLIQLALTKLVAGIMAVAVLGMSISSLLHLEDLSGRSSNKIFTELHQDDPGNHKSGRHQFISQRMFRLLTGLLATMVGFSIAPQMVTWVPGISIEQTWGSIILLGTGLLQLGFTIQPFRTILGLLTFLSGFEIIYAIAEPSALVTGLLAVVTLGLSLGGAYLLMIVSLKESE